MKGYNVRNSLKQWLHTTCDECVTLQKENRLLRNKLVDKKQKLTKEKKISSELHSSKHLELYVCRN